MPGKIFVNYRRDDVPGDARGVRDGLAAKFGKSSIFMDVDNLLVGQRFDIELARALDNCDMLIAIIGPRWTELLKARAASGERDYVREEIAEALKRRIAVVPVRVGREGNMPALPRPDELPEDIRELVLYQKHDVAHERFGRDMAELIAAIVALRKAISSGQRPVMSVPLRWISATTASLLAIGYAGAYYAGAPLPWPVKAVSDPPGLTPSTMSRTVTPNATSSRVSDPEGQTPSAKAADEKAILDKARADREAKLIADAEARVRNEIEAKKKAETDQQQRETAAKAEADRKQAAADAAAKRLPALKVEEDRARAAAEAKRKADEEAARRVPQVGQTFRDCNDGCPEMVVVPAGSFTMGSPEYETGRSSDEGPQRTVGIRQPFAVAKFEVTFTEWEACVAGGGCTGNRSPNDQGWGKGRLPVINVSWDDAKQYVTWLSRTTGKSYRLLSEAEWEYAARAGTTTPFSTGSTITSAQANFDGYYTYGGVAKGQYRRRTIDVGSFAANAFGLHDMHGNVWEWVEDCWHDSFSGAPNDGSAWTMACTDRRRVLRGGSWGNNPQVLRSASRLRGTTDVRLDLIGLRVGRTLTP